MTSARDQIQSIASDCIDQFSGVHNFSEKDQNFYLGGKDYDLFLTIIFLIIAFLLLFMSVRN